MNERIQQLAEQAGITSNNLSDGNMSHTDLKKFAELIVQECIKECKQEWYALNAESIADDNPFQDPRATGIRVGQKNGVLKCISKIKEHFGVKE